VDKALCVAAVLVAEQIAEAAEQEFLERHQPDELALPIVPFSDEVWWNVCHPGLDFDVGTLLGAVHRTAALMRARTRGAVGLRREDRRPLATDPLFVVNVFHQIVQLIGVSPPELFVRPTQLDDLMVHTCVDGDRLVPVFVAGAPLLDLRSPAEVIYITAREITYLVPEYYLARICPPAELEAIAYAALRLVREVEAPPAHTEAVDRLQGILAPAIQPEELELVEAAADRLAFRPLDFAGFVASVDATCERVALLLSGDVSCALRMAPDGLKKHELLQYAASEPYFAARRALGLARDG